MNIEHISDNKSLNIRENITDQFRRGKSSKICLFEIGYSIPAFGSIHEKVTLEIVGRSDKQTTGASTHC